MDLITPALGAIVGFSLAQFANIAQIIWASAQGAKLRIDDLGTKCRSLSHIASDDPKVVEHVYACGVQNVGKRVAASVRFQIIKIELRTKKDGSEFDITQHSALPLSVDNDGGQEVTLVPGARVSVRLAVWRSDGNILVPATATTPFQYYTQVAGQAYEYRLTVIAYDADHRFASAVFSLNPDEWSKR